MGLFSIEYHIERSISIDAPAEKVRSATEDFQEWPKWSPWLCMERSAQLTYEGAPGEVGHGYSWEGNVVGAGGMTIAENDGEQIRMDLNFLKPFKSQAKVVLELKALGNEQTNVTWHMDGSMPFFLFFMINQMKTFIGMDYERGLKMLKEYVETGSVKSETNVVGVVDVPAGKYIGVSDACSMAKIGESMGKTIPRAHQLATENELTIVGAPGAVYHNVDLKTQHCEYSAIMPVQESKAIEGAREGEIQACKALKVIHKGSYNHLGNAWSAAMAHQRHHKLKPLKSQANFEFYTNDPCEVAEEEILTEIYIPVHG